MMSCHTAVTRLSHRHTLPLTSHFTHSHACSPAQMRHTCSCLTPWPRSLKSRCFEVLSFKSCRPSDSLTGCFLHLFPFFSSIPLFVSLSLHPLSLSVSLLLLSRVSMSNCSGLQREGGMEGKRERRVYESMYIRETEQECREVEMRRTECVCVGVCALWRV